MATFNLTNNSTIFLFFFTHEDLQKGAQDKKWVYDQAEKNQSITIFFSCIGAKRHCFSAIDTELSVLRSDRQVGHQICT